MSECNCHFESPHDWTITIGPADDAATPKFLIGDRCTITIPPGLEIEGEVVEIEGNRIRVQPVGTTPEDAAMMSKFWRECEG